MKSAVIRVRMEPELEELAGHMTPVQRRALARKFRRWSRQLYVSADILQSDELPQPQRSLQPLPVRKLYRN